MIKVDDILKIVKLVLLSGYLKKHKPLSLLLIGEVGTGKTEIITNYKSSRVLFLTDISKFGLLNSIKDNKSLKHIVIPDFIKITQRKRSTSDDFISLLNSAVEEGIGLISLYNYKEDFKGKQVGLITSTTRASYIQNYDKWKKIGFVSRMIICSYSYSEETTEKIFKYIENEEYLTNNITERLKGFKDVGITSIPELNRQLEKLSDMSFRNQKQLQTLTKCHALLRGDIKVNQADINEIKRLSRYLNLRYTKL